MAQVPDYYQRMAELNGYNEQDQNAILSDYLRTGGQNLNPAETAWCAGAVNASLQQSGIKGTGSLAARSFLDWGQPVSVPQTGDVAVFSSPSRGPSAGHVGFYAGEGPDGAVRVLGGNQGDAVSYANYPSERLLGYRRPAEAGGMVDMADVAPGPAYQGQSIEPVSATGGAPMTTPGLMNLALHDPVRMESIPAPEPSLTSRLASNPFVQMGLGLLANNQNFGEGLQTGLLAAAQGEALGQRSQQNAIANELRRRQQALFQQQNMINLGGQMGLGEASPSELLRAQTAARQQDLQASEQDLREQGLWGGSTAAKKPALLTLPDGTQTVVDETEMVGRELPPGATLTRPGTASGGPGKASAKIEEKLALLDDADATLDGLERQAFGEGKPGTPEYVPGAFSGVGEGFIGRGWAGFTNALDELRQPSGGTQSEEYQRSMEAVLGTFSRMFGEKGVLSDFDILRVLKRMPQADRWPDTEEVARNLFTELRGEIARKRQEITGESTPPTTEASPPERPTTSAVHPDPASQKRLEELRAKKARGEI